MKNISVILILMLAFAACKKEDIDKFSGKDSIAFYIQGQEADSTNFTFGGLPTSKSQDTIFVKMRVVGRISNQAKAITVEAAPGTTAVEGVHYILPKMVLPADSFTLRYPIVLLNAPDLLNKTYKLVVRVKANENFESGAVGGANTVSRNIAQYKINFNNQFIKPDYWNYIQNYFGDYSDVKFKFMISTLGFSDFRPPAKGGTITYSEFLNYKVQLRNALDAYNALHGTLVDENGLEVLFPE